MLTTRLDPEPKAELERIARAQDRSGCWVADQAIRAFFEERHAVRDLMVARLEMVARESSGAAIETVHDWMLAEDDRLFPTAG